MEATQDQAERLKALLPQCMLRDWLKIGMRLARLLARPGPAQRSHLERLIGEAKASIRFREQRLARRPEPRYPDSLPIASRKDEIIAAIRSHQTVVVAGETGSGKTTQLPKMCLDAGLGIEARIGCTQPRRVAALSVSRRIAHELSVPWGREVGCKIRFSDETSPETYIKMMTDGILLAETQGDPNLSEYNALIIDEAHERSLNIDFLLGCLKGLLTRRKDLKLIITSATIDTEAFSAAFGGAPIIEVSGRSYPVEIRYAPLDAEAAEEGEITYIDAAVQHVEALRRESPRGDILVFMPSERDIREARDQIEGRCGGAADVIPLFGRLSSAEQQRVFQPSALRKIVIATNIAETSLTIPGIRYVIDPGLARISRYNPRTRTQRLPIEPIAQSSANQRAGRSGRVEDGVCVRLYSEEDFAERPRFTQPEIQRANLAEVILRMTAFRLGEIEEFPFLNPPQPQAIRAGRQLLRELGALDEANALTPLGGELARLPVDPTIGRMILEAERENALTETLVIAAGLSVQDPRERPSDQQAAADAAHKQFQDRQSDFLTLLNLWNAFHERWETLKTQNQLRKFCKARFLSYNRMREWRDIHGQLREALKDIRNVRFNDRPAHPDAIHRSILAGLLGHVAQRVEKNLYRASGNRSVMAFPASALFDRSPPAKAKGVKEKSKSAGGQPVWIMAGEIVETSRLFARTLAPAQSDWILQLGAHLCRSTFHEPYWSRKEGRVLVRERVSLHGLQLTERPVPYGRIDPQAATELFVRKALVEEGLSGEWPFLRRNRELRQKVENWQTRLRQHELADLDERFYEFYMTALGPGPVSSVDDLNGLIKTKASEPDFLFATDETLTGGRSLEYSDEAFPDRIAFGGAHVPLRYAYAPGDDQDGVTLRLPARLVPVLDAATLQWAVPGLREAQALELLRALPKAVRRQLMPLHLRAREIAGEFKPAGQDFAGQLTSFVQRQFGVDVPPTAWKWRELPPHLRPRFEILGADERVLETDRDVSDLKQRLQREERAGQEEAWESAARRFERVDLTSWTVGDLPEQIQVAELSGLPLLGYPGLALEDQHVCLRLFRSREEAERKSYFGLRKLIELALQKELAWLRKDLRSLNDLKPLWAALGAPTQLEDGAYRVAADFLIHPDPVFPLTEARFRHWVESAREPLRRLAPELADAIRAALSIRQELSVSHRAQPLVAQRLAQLMPPDFLTFTPFERLKHYPRYLKALKIRAERASVNPAKDKEKAARVAPYEAALRGLRESLSSAPPVKLERELQEFRWAIEEFHVSCFAQELGAAQPVSPKRLDEQLAALRRSIAVSA